MANDDSKKNPFKLHIPFVCSNTRDYINNFLIIHESAFKSNPRPSKFRILDTSGSIPDPARPKSQFWKDIAEELFPKCAPGAYGSRRDDSVVYDPLQQRLPFQDGGGQAKLPPLPTLDDAIAIRAALDPSSGRGDYQAHFAGMAKERHTSRILPSGRQYEINVGDDFIIPLKFGQNISPIQFLPIKGAGGDEDSVFDPLQGRLPFSEANREINFQLDVEAILRSVYKKNPWY